MLKNWCFQTVVLEETLESPLDSKEIKPVNPKGNQPWISIGRTCGAVPILWPPRCEELTHWKRPWCWERWRQDKKGITQDEMIGRHHRLNGHLQEPGMMDRGAWHAAVHGVTKYQTPLNGWTELKIEEIQEQKILFAAKANFFFFAFLNTTENADTIISSSLYRSLFLNWLWLLIIYI